MPWDAVLPNGVLQAAEDDPSLGGMDARTIQRMRGFCLDRAGRLEWSIQLDALPVLFQGWPVDERDTTRKAPGAVRLELMLRAYLARHQLMADIADVYHQALHPDRGYLRIRNRAQAAADRGSLGERVGELCRADGCSPAHEEHTARTAGVVVMHAAAPHRKRCRIARRRAVERKRRALCRRVAE